MGLAKYFPKNRKAFSSFHRGHDGSGILSDVYSSVSKKWRDISDRGRRRIGNSILPSTSSDQSSYASGNTFSSSQTDSSPNAYSSLYSSHGPIYADDNGRIQYTSRSSASGIFSSYSGPHQEQRVYRTVNGDASNSCTSEDSTPSGNPPLSISMHDGVSISPYPSSLESSVAQFPSVKTSEVKQRSLGEEIARYGGRAKRKADSWSSKYKEITDGSSLNMVTHSPVVSSSAPSFSASKVMNSKTQFVRDQGSFQSMGPSFGRERTSQIVSVPPYEDKTKTHDSSWSGVTSNWSVSSNSDGNRVFGLDRSQVSDMTRDMVDLLSELMTSKKAGSLTTSISITKSKDSVLGVQVRHDLGFEESSGDSASSSSRGTGDNGDLWRSSRVSAIAETHNRINPNLFGVRNKWR
ncbi:uncharacterized protein I206_101315 [Kwoniella pini CBS 10737]|uniref:Uncharacterized protein n=1 Tax=Kwoniella pini CBS 10737 TaxID=1296096 RepID=A0A1B9IB88_9TREE|nr:uncharacterized protein I206_00009 [Kwoniella pini CBS 10737]OCF52713.1 hypothetical protein I206_00009 [Kwoniella pini CBS 10737]